MTADLRSKRALFTLEKGFSLGEVRIQPQLNSLIIDGEERRLEPKIMDVLVCLAEARGQIVSKSELLDRVWADRFVVDAVLKRGIHELRKALGDSAKAPRYIETVSKRGYRLILDVTPIETEKESDETIIDEGQPYHGLGSFGFEDAGYFVGREQQINDVLNAMRKQETHRRTFLLISGPSGAGKSSLVRAGVIPHLLNHGLYDSGEQWLRSEFVLGQSGGSIFETLVNALLQPSALTAIDDQATSTQQLQQILTGDSSEMLAWFKQTLDSGSKHRLILLMDQFEELLTGTHPEAPAVFELIHTLARSGLVWIIATMRNDFFPEMAKHDTLLRLSRGDGKCEIRPPGPAQIGRIIHDPARRAGLTFERHKDGEGLDDLLHDASQDHPDILPLLQFTLTALYQHRQPDGMLTFEAYKNLGGINGCVARHAEAVYEQLPDEVKAALPRLMATLVVPARGDHASFACRPMLLSEAENENAVKLIENFLNARLLSASIAPDGSRWIRFTHLAVIQHWPRARDWLQLNQEQVRLHEWLGDQSTRWQNAERNSDFLLSSGKPLSDATSLLESQQVILSDTEQEFVQQSQQKANRKHRIRQGSLIAMAAISAIALLAAFTAKQAQRSAQEQSLRATNVTEFLVETFAVADPGSRSPQMPTALDLLDQGAARIDGEFANQPQVESALRLTMGKAYLGLSLYDQAESQLRRALALRENDTLDAAEAMVSLGAMLRVTGKIEEAQQQLDQALTIQQQQLGTQHAVTATTLDELGMVANARGDPTDAEPLLLQALNIRKNILGTDALEVADSLNNLAAVGIQLGKLDSAADYYAQSIAIYRNHKEIAGLRLGNALSNAASVHYALRDLEAASGLYQDAISIYQSYPQSPSSDIAVLQSNYGSVLRENGQVAVARDVFSEAYESLKSDLGERHITTSKIAIKLADTDIRLRRLDDAEQLLNQTIVILDSELGQSHWLSAYARSVLAGKLHAEGDPSTKTKAQSMARSALAAIKLELGGESPYTLDADRRLQRILGSGTSQ